MCDYFAPLIFQLKDFESKKTAFGILLYFLHGFDDLRILMKDVLILFFHKVKHKSFSFSIKFNFKISQTLSQSFPFIGASVSGSGVSISFLFKPSRSQKPYFFDKNLPILYYLYK